MGTNERATKRVFTHQGRVPAGGHLPGTPPGARLWKVLPEDKRSPSCVSPRAGANPAGISTVAPGLETPRDLRDIYLSQKGVFMPKGLAWVGKQLPMEAVCADRAQQAPSSARNPSPWR